MKVAWVTGFQCHHSFGYLSSRDPLKANRTFRNLIAAECGERCRSLSHLPICLPGTIQEKSNLPLNVIHVVQLGHSYSVKPLPRSCTAYCVTAGKKKEIRQDRVGGEFMSAPQGDDGPLRSVQSLNR